MYKSDYQNYEELWNLHRTTNNVEKTQAKYIGLLSSSDYLPHGLSWIKTHLETLGIVIIDNYEDNYKYNFHQKT